MQLSKINLEQWYIFQTVIDEGSFANASKKLHKSQSTISYALQQLQLRLGVELLEIIGRKSVLTESGHQLLKRSRRLTQVAFELETSANSIKQGVEGLVRLMVDGIFPRALLFNCLTQFECLNLPSVLELREGILSGTTQAIQEDTCDIAITTKTPEGMIGVKLIDVRSFPYAHLDSPLHQLGRNLTTDDLHHERYIVVMDSGDKIKRNEGWLGSAFRWTVDSMYLKSSLMAQGIGFSWLPRHMVEHSQLPLKVLPFDKDVSRTYPVYLVYKDEESIGPACRRLIDLLIHESNVFSFD